MFVTDEAYIHRQASPTQGTMPAATGITRWRDKPIVPEDYEDVATLVRVARKARGRIVEFDWAFSREDLLRLRRAEYEWGCIYKGRYKVFDVRVLEAISDALGETDTPFALNEPKNRDRVDCTVSCVRDGDYFRLLGYAPFDIVLGYGRVGTEQGTEESIRLGPTVQRTLANAVGMLGWDLRRLQEERFRPVWNAIYGLPIDYRIRQTQPAAGPATDVEVHFHGPFSTTDDGRYPCLFAHEMAERHGVYLWTINVGGREQLWYVGQTLRTFGTRIGEHLAGFLSGQYTTYDAAALSRGENRLAVGSVSGEWPQKLPSFLRNCERLMPNIIALIRLINIHVAPLDRDAPLHSRIEGAVGRHYYAHPDSDLRDFLTPGLRVPAVIPLDKPVRLVLSSDVPIAGLPPYLLT